PHAETQLLSADLAGAPTAVESRTAARPPNGGPLPRDRGAGRDRSADGEDRPAGYGPPLLGASRMSAHLRSGMPEDGRGRARSGSCTDHLPGERASRGDRLLMASDERPATWITRPGPAL